MDELTYLTLTEPKAAAQQKTGVLMLLHGVGSNEQNMLPLAVGTDARLGVISLRGPRKMGGNAFGWFPVSFTSAGPVIDGEQAEDARQTLLAFIATYRKEHAVDDVYLMGFSQGAIMALVAALSEPASIQGAVCLSGRFPPEFQGTIAPATELMKTDLWIGHGTADDKLPIDYARAIHSLLAGLEVPFSYQEFPTGHSISLDIQAKAHRWLSVKLDTKEL